MKKTTLFICILLILGVFVSCGTVSRDFFIIPAQGADDNKLVNAGFQSGYDCGILTKEVSKVLSVSKETVISPIDGKTFTYKNSNCKLKSYSSEECGDYYSIYDVYYSEDRDRIELLHGTDTICFYNNNKSFDRSVAPVEEAEAKEIADNFLKSIMSDASFEKFAESYVEYDKSLCQYYIGYLRYIAGYETDETLLVGVTNTKEVSGYNGYNLKKYDALESSITVESLKSADEALTEKIETLKLDNLTFTATRITTNAAGEVYLEKRFTYKTDDNFDIGAQAFVKIE